MRRIAALILLALLAGCGGGGGGSAGTGTPTDTESFFVYNFDTMNRYSISTVKVAEGTHCHIYAETGWIDNVGLSTVTVLANGLTGEFDTVIYPNVVAGFGSEPNPGVDGDPKIFIVLLDIIDGFTDGSYIAGYFDPLNEYPNLTGSNGKEVFFMDIDPGNPVSQTFYKTLAHEFQHMIHWEQKTNLLGLIDDTWLDEAMSEVAPFLAGYGANYSRVFTFEEGDNRSDSLTSWGGELKDYAVAYMWAQYIADRFPDNVFRGILSYDDTGIDSVTGYLDSYNTAHSTSLSFSSVFRDWSIAVFSGTTVTWPGHAEWSFSTVDTWAGNHGGWVLPGLITAGNRNDTSLPGLEPWGIDLYWYTSASPDPSLTWSAGGSPASMASFYDWSPGGTLEFDMADGVAYSYDNAAVLILQNPAGTGTAVASTVNPILAETSSSLPTPAEKLSAASRSRTALWHMAVTGEPMPVDVHDILFRNAMEARRKYIEERNAH